MNTTSLTSYAQTAYRPGISCRDSIFAGLEAERKFVDEGDTVFTNFFDLDSAFHTVEFCILLCELFNAGVKGKCWRLIQNWHSNITSKVKLGKPLSQSFSISISKGIQKVLFCLQHCSISVSLILSSRICRKNPWAWALTVCSLDTLLMLMTLGP